MIGRATHTTHAPLRRRLLLAPLILALIAAACSDTVSPITSDMPLAEQIATARSLWAEAGPESYDMIVERTCRGCPPSKTRNTVVDGRLIAVQSMVEGGPIVYTVSEAMEDVFTELDGALYGPPDTHGAAEFDERTGAVKVWTRMLGNDERSLQVTMEPATSIEPTSHGSTAATQSCPSTDFVTIDGSEFSISLPADLRDEAAEGVDSEVGTYSADGIEVSWDFGWYSNPLDYWEGPIETRLVNYSGIGGRVVVAEPVPEIRDGRHITAAHFMRISGEPDAWNSLTVSVVYDDASSAPLADCIITSVDWL